MAQIIQGQGGFGAQFGTALGQGLSNGIEQYAHGKLKQLHRRQGLKGLEGVIPKEVAELYYDSDPAVQKHILNQLVYDEGNEAQHAQREQERAGLAQLGHQQRATGQLQGLQGQPQSELDQGRNHLRNNQEDIGRLMQQLSGQGAAAAELEPLRKAGFRFRRPDEAPVFGSAEQANALKQESNNLKREQHEFAKQQKIEEFEEKKQAAIDKKYSKLTEQFEKDYTIGTQLQILAEEMAALNEEIGEDWHPVKEGLVQGINGATRGLVDLRSQAGKAAEQFRNKANQYIDLSSNAIKGLPSKYRVQIKESAKPSLAMTYEARKESINDAIKHAQVLQVPFQEEERILEENEGKLPEDFSRRALPSIQKRQEQILRGNRESGEHEFETLEEAQEFARQNGGKVIENTETKKKFKA
jgi:hypothetical protein